MGNRHLSHTHDFEKHFLNETYVGGMEVNKHESKKSHAGLGAFCKTSVAGVMYQPSNQILAELVNRTDASTLQGFVVNHSDDDASVFNNETLAYKGIPLDYTSFKHSVVEFVDGMAHTNGVQSFWTMLRRASKKYSASSACSKNQSARVNGDNLPIPD